MCRMCRAHRPYRRCILFFFNDTATTEIYSLSLHDALPILAAVLAERGIAEGANVGLLCRNHRGLVEATVVAAQQADRSEEHTSELQSHLNLVCRPILEKKKTVYPLQGNSGTMHICARELSL